MEVILDPWMFSVEYLIGFAIVFIGVFIWMWKSNFEMTKPKKGDEWVLITYITGAMKGVWGKLWKK